MATAAAVKDEEVAHKFAKDQLKAFVERVWAWKAESGGAIVAQLKRLGASCDWSRERFTLDEGLSRAAGGQPVI